MNPEKDTERTLEKEAKWCRAVAIAVLLIGMGVPIVSMMIGDNWRRELKTDIPKATTELRLSHTRRVEDNDHAWLLGQTFCFFGGSLGFLFIVASTGDAQIKRQERRIAELERRLGETGEAGKNR